MAAAAAPVHANSILPPIHAHVKILRPKECDIAWHHPIRMPKQAWAYNIRVFKDDDSMADPIQDYSVHRLDWNISNLEPQGFYVVHIHLMVQSAQGWVRSEQAATLRFTAAPTRRQRADKLLPPGAPLDARMVPFDDEQLRHAKKQRGHVVIAWQCPERFRGTLSYKIAWNSHLLGVTSEPFADLGLRTRVSQKFEFLHQRKLAQSLSDEQCESDDDDEEDEEDEEFEEEEEEECKASRPRPTRALRRFDALQDTTLTLRSTSFYKKHTRESLHGCDLKLDSWLDSDSGSDQHEAIAWRDMYGHDLEREQIVIWLYLETSTRDTQLVQPLQSMSLCVSCVLSVAMLCVCSTYRRGAEHHAAASAPWVARAALAVRGGVAQAVLPAFGQFLQHRTRGGRQRSACGRPRDPIGGGFCGIRTSPARRSTRSSVRRGRPCSRRRAA